MALDFSFSEEQELLRADHNRRGVIVDDSGSLVGTVRAHEVLTAIEQADRPELAEPEKPGAPAA